MFLFDKKNIFKFLLIISLFIIFITFSAYSYSEAVNTNISNNIFRLHIIANSDSEEDQNLKYKVRDNLISYMNTLIPENSSKSEIVKIANNHLSDFYNIAYSTIKDNGYDYSVNISIGKCNFPTKTYGDIALPAGTYDALRVEIGEAKGHNWWCVMFPPLCFVDVTSGIVPDDSKSLLKDSLDNEEYDLVTADLSSDSEISLKFKIVEMIEDLKNNSNN